MKTKLFLFGLFTLLITGCKPIYRTHVLINTTGYTLVIKGYRIGGNGISSATAEPIYMDPLTELSFNRSDGEDYIANTFFSIESVDSVTITFNSEKILIESCHSYPNPECHPILEGAIEVTITEEDYNNAVPIEN